MEQCGYCGREVPEGSHGECGPDLSGTCKCCGMVIIAQAQREGQAQEDEE